MGTGYQEDKKEQYEKMMKEIAGHQDFGKRNPVDIGIECGYLEEDVMEMIQFLYDSKDKQWIEDGNSEREIYYFLLTRKNRQHIVSVNVKTWKAMALKDSPLGGRTIDMYSCFQIRGNIFAWSYGRRRLYWKNLEDGSHGEFHADGEIGSILIAKEGIVVVSGCLINYFGFNGEKRACFCGHSLEAIFLSQNGSVIYGVMDSYYGSEIWKIEMKNFDIQKKIFGEDNCRIVAIENTAEGLCWYASVDDKDEDCRRYSEQDFPNYTICSDIKNSHKKYSNEFEVSEVIRTKKYKLIQKKVYDMSNGKFVANFDRAMTIHEGYLCNGRGGFNNGQAVGIYDKDIFIAVRRDNAGNENIIKRDMRNGEEAVILPIQTQSEAYLC